MPQAALCWILSRYADAAIRAQQPCYDDDVFIISLPMLPPLPFSQRYYRQRYGQHIRFSLVLRLLRC